MRRGDSLGDISKMAGPNDGTRSLVESILAPTVIAALKAWSEVNTEGVLVGGLALSYYVKPRMTEDIDLLFPSEQDVPTNVEGFERSQGRAFSHGATGVKVDLFTPALLGIPLNVAREVVRTALVDDDVRIASPSALVALKLYRLNSQGKADIVALIKTGRVDVAGFSLPRNRVDQYLTLIVDALSE